MQSQTKKPPSRKMAYKFYKELFYAKFELCACSNQRCRSSWVHVYDDPPLSLRATIQTVGIN
jgi:hypothetical protein